MANPFSLMDYWAGLVVNAKLMVHLFTVKLDGNVPHVIGDFSEADFPGYDVKELTPTLPQNFLGGDYGILDSTMLVWSYPEGANGDFDLNGFWIAAEIPGQASELVTWMNFNETVHLTFGSLPFGLVILLAARLDIVTPLVPN